MTLESQYIPLLGLTLPRSQVQLASAIHEKVQYFLLLLTPFATQKSFSFAPDLRRENRLCTLCHLEGDNSVEDEIHFLVRCPVYQKLRENLLPQHVLLDRNMTDEQKFVEIMTNFEVKNIARFVYLAFEERKIKLDVLSTLKDLVSSTEILLKKERNTPDPGKPNTFQIKWCSNDGMKLTLSRV